MSCCIRCGSENNIEHHHIIQRIDSGNDDDNNIENRCHPCHKLEHARREIMRAFKGETQKDRLELLTLRLEILEKYNTPELIRQRGTFQSYSIEPRAIKHLPRIKSKKEIPRELQPELIPVVKG